MSEDARIGEYAGLSTRAYLQQLANRYGDFKVATTFRKPDGNVVWSKHYSVLDLWSTPDEMFRLDRARHRTLFPFEAVVDFETRNIDLEAIIRKCGEWKKPFQLYDTGSKGYHLHIFSAVLLDKKPIERTAVRKRIIRSFRNCYFDKRVQMCDLLKTSENVMIALEGVPHWKSGKPKEMVYCGGYF